MGNLADIVEITTDEGAAQILAEWAALDIPVDSSFEDGGFPAMVARAGGYIRSCGSKEAVALKSCTIGELLSGDALELWSKSVYGHTRNKSKPAVWRLHVSCASDAGPYTIYEGSLVVTDGSLTFRSTGDTENYPATVGFSLPVTVRSGSSADIAVYCETDGSAGGKVIPGAINRMVTTFAGVTVTNAELLSSGADAETDKELKQRNSTWWTTRNKLTLVRDAYIYYARSADSAVKRVGFDATNPRGEFTLDVYLAGDSGAPGSTTIATVLADLQGRLLPEIASRLQVKPTTTVNQTLTGKAYYLSGFTLSAVQAAIETAIANLVKSLPIQGKTYAGFGQNQILRSQYEKAILSATVGDQLCMSLVELENPPAAITLGVGESVTVDSITFGFGGIELYGVSE